MGVSIPRAKRAANGDEQNGASNGTEGLFKRRVDVAENDFGCGVKVQFWSKPFPATRPDVSVRRRGSTCFSTVPLDSTSLLEYVPIDMPVFSFPSSAVPKLKIDALLSHCSNALAS